MLNRTTKMPMSIKRERGHASVTEINNIQRCIITHIEAWGHLQNAKYHNE